MTARARISPERKAFQANCRKLVKVLGNRPAPPPSELERRYREWKLAKENK